MASRIEWRGNAFSDENRAIMSARGVNHQALISDALEADSFDFVVITKAQIPLAYTVVFPSDAVGELMTSLSETVYVYDEGTADFSMWKHGDPVRIYNDGEFIAEYYLTNVAPQGYTTDGRVFVKFSCVSFVGLVVEMAHKGGVYVNARTGDVIADILGATEDAAQSTAQKKTYTTPYGIKYTIDTPVYRFRVDGHLPYADGEQRTARDNLRDVLFACGASMLKGSDGFPWFTFNQPAEPVQINVTDIYAGDKYALTETVSDVSVVENAYIQQSTTKKTLYEGIEPVQNVTVLFDEPICSLSTPASMSVSEWGANYAVISGSGILEGFPYAVVKKLHTKHIADGVPKVKTADVGLVSTLNWDAVSKRMAAYFSAAREVKAKFVLRDGVRTGALVSFVDPLGVTKTGYIKDNSFVMSSIIAGDTTVVVDWRPVEAGNTFDTSETLTGSGTWSKAAAEAAIGREIKTMRVVLIGGGSGGQNGGDGKPGERAGAGGDGGIAGVGGECGDVYVVDLESVPASISFSCGVGGEIASPGTATTANISGTSYSSANGSKPLAGMINIITGELLALNGESGVNGGNGYGYGSTGSRGGDVTFGGITYSGGAINTNAKYSSWRDMYVENNGTPSARLRVDTTSSGLHEIAVSGSGGGGAAVGANGTAGGSSRIGVEETYRDPVAGRNYTIYVENARSGAGGAGATAVDRTETPEYGCGGYGGHGGGGGGCSGKASGEYGGAVAWSTRTDSSGNKTITITKQTYAAIVGAAGAAGLGGKASKGGAGCIWLIY